MSYYQGTPTTVVKLTKKLTTNGSHKSLFFSNTSNSDYQYRLLRAMVITNGCSADAAIVAEYDTPFDNSYDDYDRVIEYVNMKGTYDPDAYYSSSFSFLKSAASENGDLGTFNYDGSNDSTIFLTSASDLELGANISGISSSSDYLYCEIHLLKYQFTDNTYYSETWN